MGKDELLKRIDLVLKSHKTISGDHLVSLVGRLSILESGLGGKDFYGLESRPTERSWKTNFCSLLIHLNLV